MIFEKFTQADSRTIRRYGEPGPGDAFHVGLELPEAAPLPQEVPVNGAVEVTDPSYDREGGVMARILVVEDNPTNQKVVAGLLGKRGYQTTVASHGGEALEALEKSAFDLVLMDVQMPILDGLETTRLIRQDARWRTLPIVGLTAHAMVGDRQRCLDAGMNDYLAKPVRQAELVETVKKYVPPSPVTPAADTPASRQPQMRDGLDVVGLGKQVH